MTRNTDPATLARAFGRYREAMSEVERRRRRFGRLAKASGRTLTDLAEIAGVSKQRISQIIRDADTATEQETP